MALIWDKPAPVTPNIYNPQHAESDRRIVVRLTATTIAYGIRVSNGRGIFVWDRRLLNEVSTLSAGNGKRSPPTP